MFFKAYTSQASNYYLFKEGTFIYLLKLPLIYSLYGKLYMVSVKYSVK